MTRFPLNSRSAVSTDFLIRPGHVRKHDLEVALNTFRSEVEHAGFFGLPGQSVRRRTSEKLIEVASVKDFGALGDGITDDADAIALAAASLHDGGELVFPAGIYYIDRMSTDGIDRYCLDLTDRHNLCISGCGAFVKHRGDYERTRLNRPWGFIRIKNCSRISIEGLDIDGGCDTVIKNEAVTETASHGIAIQGSYNIDLRNIHVHHHCHDGICASYSLNAGQDGATRVVSSRNIRLDNVVSVYNGRQGLSVVNVLGLVATGCEFSFTAKSGYGGHAPMAGVDCEPDFKVADNNVGKMVLDHDQTAIQFIGCSFRGNRGAQVTAAYPESQSNIAFDACYVEPHAGDYNIAIIGSATVASWRNLHLDFSLGEFQFSPLYADGTCTIESCFIRSRGFGLTVETSKPRPLFIQNSRFVATIDRPGQFAPWVRNSGTRFHNCQFEWDLRSHDNTAVIYPTLLGAREFVDCEFTAVTRAGEQPRVRLWDNPQGHLEELRNCYVTGAESGLEKDVSTDEKHRGKRLDWSLSALSRPDGSR